MRAAALLALAALASAASSRADDSATRETALIEGFLKRDGAAARADLVAARRELAEAARVSAPSWRLHARREEALDAPAAFTTDVVGVGVSIGLASLNPIERRRAAAESEAFRHAMRAELAGVVSDLRLLLLDAWRAQREAAVLRESRARLDGMVSELQGLVDGGEHSKFDLLRMQELLRAQSRRAVTAQAAAEAARARVAALCGAAAPEVELGPWPDVPLNESLRSLAAESHPALLALRRRAEASASALDLAARSHAASLDVTGGYRRDDEPGVDASDGYEIEVGVSLPQLALRRLAQAEARAEQGEAALELARAEQRLAADLDAAMENLRLLQDIAPAAGSAADELREGGMSRYRAGESDLTELVEIIESLQERALLDIEAEAARRRARVELDRVTSLLTAPDIARVVEESLK